MTLEMDRTKVIFQGCLVAVVAMMVLMQGPISTGDGTVPRKTELLLGIETLSGTLMASIATAVLTQVAIQSAASKTE